VATAGKAAGSSAANKRLRCKPAGPNLRLSTQGRGAARCSGLLANFLTAKLQKRLRAGVATAGKAVGSSGQRQTKPARLRKGSGRLREAPGRPGHRRQGCGKAPAGRGCGKVPESSWQPWRPPARLWKGFGKLRAAQMHVIFTANELQAVIAHGRRCKSSASCEQTL
jgi:hypothetical protein